MSERADNYGEVRQEVQDSIRAALQRLADAEGYPGYVAHFYATSELALEDSGYTRFDCTSEGASRMVARGLLFDALVDPGWHS